MKKLYLIIIILVLNFSLVFSAENTINQKELIKISKKITKELYPNSHEVLIDNLVITNYDETGKSMRIDDVYIKVLDELGKEGNQSLTLEYNKSYGFSEAKALQLIKPDGKIIDIDIEKNMTDQVSPDGEDANIYDPNQRLVTINIPGIEVNDVLHYFLIDTTTKARIKGNFSNLEYCQYTYPFVKSTFIIQGPTSLPLKNNLILNKIDGKYKKTLETKDGMNIYKIELNNVPQIESEPSMPPMTRVVMRWIVTTLNDWEDISRWYYDLSEEKMIYDEDIIKKANDLIIGKTTDIEKIEAIFYFVSRKVRYMGVTQETNRPGLEPHATDYTFDTMTGVCRDKAALIVVMLRMVGFDANMVLINTSRKLDFDVPLSYFNHAICGVKLKDGTNILMDPTDETTKDLLPQFEMDKTYLMATKNGDTLKLTPVISANRNMLKVNSEIEYKKNKFICETTISFLGINDNAYRDYFIKLNNDKRSKFIVKIIKGFSLNSELKSFKLLPEDLLNSTDEFKLVINFEINDPTIMMNGYEMINFPVMGQIIGLHNWALGDTTLKDRKFNLKTRFTASLSEEVNLKLPSSEFNVEALPKKIDLNKNGYKLNASYTKKDNYINFKKYYSLNKLEYDVKEYKELLESLKLEETFNKRYIIINSKNK